MPTWQVRTGQLKPARSNCLTRACQFVALTAVAATIGVLIGALDFRTRWEDPGGGYGYDRFIHWGAEATGLGCVALILLLHVVDGLRDERRAHPAWLRRAAVLSLLAAGACAGAAWIARWYWQPPRSGSAIPGVEVFIAGGLSLVDQAGTAGSILAVILAALLWWQRRPWGAASR